LIGTYEILLLILLTTEDVSMLTGVLLDDLLVAEDSASAESTSAVSLAAAANASLARSTSPGAKLPEGNKHAQSEVTTSDRAVVMTNPVAVHANGDSNMEIGNENVRSYGHGNAKGVESLVQASAAEAEAMSAALAAAEARAAAARESTGEAGEKYTSDRDRGSDATSSGKPPASPSSAALIALNRACISGSLNHTPPTGVRLHHRVVVVAAESGGASGGVVRQLSIDQFENEGRRVSYGTPDSTSQARRLLDRQMSISGVQKKVLSYLLKPRGWKPPVKRQFFLDCNEIAELCEASERLFARESSVLQIRAPVKIFGDLHGQFGDLMRLFDEYGSPSTAGDIT
jgi:protein phosphatase